MLRFTVSFILLIALSVTASAKVRHKDFPVDDILRVRVDFWKKVYTEITSGEGFLHDSENLNVIYEKISVAGLSRRQKKRLINRKKREIKNRIQALRSKPSKKYSTKEAAFFKQLGSPNRKELTRFRHRVRFQQGMRDRYYDGLARSMRYLKKIQQIFRRKGLPKELSYLPHVESSFNYRAYSKVGAAGMWQFMRPTARLYKLKVNYIVDERRDPIASTKAAAWFLKDNYRRLGTWPLALTAYNHGPASIKRAVRAVNSTDISKIIQKYEGRRFGFASKNFYATFMATVEISEDPSKYFSKLPVGSLPKSSSFRLPQSLTIDQIAQSTGFDRRTLENYNLRLRPVVFRNSIYLPEGFRVSIPYRSSSNIAELKTALSQLKVKKNDFASAGQHVVSRGESLYSIARLYRVAMTDLIVFNGINNPSRIIAGTRLRIPKDKSQVKAIRKKVKTQDRDKEQKALIPEYIARLPVKEPTREKLASIDDFSSLDFFNAKVRELTREVVGVNLASYEFELKKKGKNYLLRVEPEETLGHYAEWANVPTRQIRKLNGIRFGGAIWVGQKLVVPISGSRLSSFKTKRIEHHLAIEEDFFSNYALTGTQEYKIRRGDTIAQLTQEYEIPFWLLRRVQDGGQLNMQVGETVRIPVIEEK